MGTHWGSSLCLVRGWRQGQSQEEALQAREHYPTSVGSEGDPRLQPRLCLCTRTLTSLCLSSIVRPMET